MHHRRTNTDIASVEEQLGDSAIALGLIFAVKFNNSLAFPVLQPEITRNFTVMKIILSIALTPAVEFVLPQVDMLQKENLR